ncbi:MAG: antibiotic biosynthesis monooxygenase [Thermoproteota archaeon]|nr:antibiotic biosynthesis monooxygenase [Thermoproteota archaeon]
MNLAHDQEDGPITVIVTRTAKKGRIKEFEDWMDGIVHESLKFEGHLGVNIIRPVEESKPEYVIIFRFNTLDNLLKWEKSQARKDWLKKSKDVVEGEDKVQKVTGLEFWFTPRSAHRYGREAINNEASGQTVNVPPRYKMAIVTAGIVFVLLNTLIPQIRQLTATLPLLLSSLLGVIIMVLLMTYLIMPSVTRLLKPWLYKKRLI